MSHCVCPVLWPPMSVLESQLMGNSIVSTIFFRQTTTKTSHLRITGHMLEEWLTGIYPLRLSDAYMRQQREPSLYPHPTKLEGGVYWNHLVRPSVRLSVRPSVCRPHGFRSISQVSFGISISNFICMLIQAIGRSPLIFSDVTFKMVAWRPYWNFLVSGL